MQESFMNCLIIGSNASIGSAIVDQFHDNSYKVFGLNKTQQEDKKTILDYQLRIHSSENNTSTDFPKNINALVFCIGKIWGKPALAYSADEIVQCFDSNIIEIIKLLQYTIPKLSDNASVVFIGSIAASAGSFDEIYSASKSALYGLTKSLAKNTTRSIRYNCISPGLIRNTTMFDDFTPAQVKIHEDQTPNNQLVNKNDLAGIIFDICQPHWSMLNGQILDVNGGRYV